MPESCIITLGKKTYSLLYTADAYFEINETAGEDFMDKLLSQSRLSWDTAISCFAIMAREGELTRRWRGMAPEELVSEEELRRILMPADIPKIKKAVIEAVCMGLHVSGENGAGPRDLGLMEYEKKTDHD